MTIQLLQLTAAFLSFVLIGSAAEQEHVCSGLQREARTALEQGRLAEAERLLLDSLREAKKLGTDHPCVGASYSGLATVYKAKAEFGKAEHFCRLGLTFATEKYGLRHQNVAALLNSCGDLYYVMARYDEAAELFNQALEIAKETLPPDSLETAGLWIGLGEVYRMQARYEAAEEALTKGLKIAEQDPEKARPHLIKALDRLASLRGNQGDRSEAVSLREKALALAEEGHLENLQLATCLNNLAFDYVELGRFEEAEPLHQRALTIHRKVLGAHHPTVAASLNNLAEISRYREDLGQAEVLYREALSIKLDTLGMEHPSTEVTVNNLAQIYQEQGKYTEAHELYRHSVAIARKTLGPEHPNLARALNNWGTLYFDEGNYQEAIRLLLEAVSVREKTGHAKHPQLARVISTLGAAHDGVGLEDEGRTLAQVAMALSGEDDLGPQHAPLVLEVEQLVELYQDNALGQEAAWLMEFVVTFKEEIYGPESLEALESLEDYALVLKDLGRADEALQVEQRAATIRESLGKRKR